MIEAADSRPSQATLGPPAERAERVARLIDVLGRAALDRRLAWRDVELAALILHRFDHLATAAFWSTYHALNGAPPVGGRRR